MAFLNKNLEYIIFFLLVLCLFILITKHNWEYFMNEQTGINKLDAIIYINLENRQDRKTLLLKELESLNTNMSKVYKVSGVFIPKNGHKGCVQSHILALNMIKLNKWERVLILEDDAQLDTTPTIVNKIIETALDTLDTTDPNWNVIMLASVNKIVNNKMQQIKIDIDNTITLEKIKSATTSSAYIIKSSYIDKILNLFNTCNNNMNHNKLTGNNFEQWALDQKWATLQEHDNWYAISPNPIKQREIWSTILNESHH